MAELFGRRVRVIVDDLQVEDLRVVFRCEKDLYKVPNTLKLQIYNLSAASRARMAKKGAHVTVLAGYGSDLGQVYQGDTRTTDHVQRKADWVTEIQAGDGEAAYCNARFDASFAGGSNIVDVLKAAAKSMGVGLGNALQRFEKGDYRGGLQEFSNGFTAHGKASKELDRLLESVGLTWSIQDGQLQILKAGEALAGQAVLLTPKTGLVGSPAHGTPNVNGMPSVLKTRALLQARIRPGSPVRIESQSVSGQFTAQKVCHLGDTKGGDWYTDLELLP